MWRKRSAVEVVEGVLPRDEMLEPSGAPVTHTNTHKLRICSKTHQGSNDQSNLSCYCYSEPLNELQRHDMHSALKQ